MTGIHRGFTEPSAKSSTLNSLVPFSKFHRPRLLITFQFLTLSSDKCIPTGAEKGVTLGCLTAS